MLHKLIEYMEKKKLISIYKNDNLQDFSLGVIDTMDSNFIRLRTLSNDGIYLGYEIIKIDSISRIDEDSDYDKKVYFLSQNFKGKYSEIKLNSNNKKDSVLFDIIETVKINKIVVSIGLSKDTEIDIIGIIDNILNDIVTIIALDDNGKEIEKCSIHIDNIFHINCGDKKLQIIQFLKENNFTLNKN